MRMIVKKACVVFALAFVLVCSLSGCVQMAIGLDIKQDGSADVSLKMGVASEAYSMVENGGEDLFAESKKQAQENGYTVEEYEEDGYRGLVMHSGAVNLEQTSDADPYVEGLVLKREKAGLKQIMSLSGMMSSVQSLKNNIGAASIDTSQFDLKLTVTMPYPITSTNAAQIYEDGRTAEWDLAHTDSISLVCASDVLLFGMPVKAVLCVVGALAVLAVILIVTGAVRKRKLRREEKNASLE